MKSAAHVRYIGERVEIAEHAVAVDENDIRGGSSGRIQTRQAQTAGARPRLDRTEVRVAGFVRRDDQTRIRNLVANAQPGGK